MLRRRKIKRLAVGGAIAFVLTLLLVVYSLNFFNTGANVKRTVLSPDKVLLKKILVKNSSLSPATITVHANKLLSLVIQNDDNIMHKLIVLQNASPLRVKDLELCRDIGSRKLNYLEINEFLLGAKGTIQPAFEYFSEKKSKPFTDLDPKCIVLSCPTCTGKTKEVLISFIPE